ncbi:hypothetical protein AB1L30_05355 [Bremerella sp. JC817]|uniref:hypothetical protein n=1 Tax=Bremerella sp. JC817 TaxID=3231756 RepID=UPI003459E4D7
MKYLLIGTDAEGKRFERTIDAVDKQHVRAYAESNHIEIETIDEIYEPAEPSPRYLYPLPDRKNPLYAYAFFLFCGGVPCILAGAFGQFICYTGSPPPVVFFMTQAIMYLGMFNILIASIFLTGAHIIASQQDP